MFSPKLLKLLFLAGTALSAPALAQELPTGGTVGAGNVNIATPGPGVMTINQGSQAAVVNWQGFSIGAGGVVTVAQPNGQSVILNRVTGSATTSIAGQLNANGQVYIVNPNGIAITGSGVVNVGGFVGSTLGISDEDFLKGNYAFAGDGTSAGVSNAGRIQVAPGGYAALLGGRVDNSGVINAPLGRIGLGAGERVTLDLSGDGFLQVTMPSQDGGTDALISSSGTISADGGRVQISAAAAQDAARHVINLSGVVEARTVSGRSGAIVLGGSGGAVRVSGTLDTSARTAAPAAQPAVAGNITITGADIGLEGATIDASGLDGGGQVRIGGDYYGQGILPTAATLSVDDASIIYADALEDGDGGGVVLWSEELTSFAGNISAKGAGAGAGGFVEVSGKHLLDYRGLTDLRATSGDFGTLLLDPYNIFITGSATTPTSVTPGADVPTQFTPNGDDSNIDAADLETQLGLADVTVSTGGAGSPGTQAGNITVTVPLTWAAATTLRLEAFNDISILADIAATAGGFDLRATNGNIVLGTNPSFGLNIQTGLGFTAIAGSSIGGGAALAPTAITSAGNVDMTAGGALDLIGFIDGGADVTLTAASMTGGVGIDTTGNVVLTTTVGDMVLASLIEAGGSVTGSSAGAISVQSSVNAFGGPIQLVAVGPFTIGAPGNFSSSDSDVILVGSQFTNNGGPEAVTAGGRLLVYSTNWAADTRGGLEGANLYGRTFALNPPGSLPPTGDYFIYSDQPTLTFTTPGGTRIYGDTPGAPGTPVVTGLVNDDTFAYAANGTPVANDPTTTGSPVGTYAITTTGVTPTTVGYLFAYSNGNMVITPAPLTVTAGDLSKVYGQTIGMVGTGFTATGLRNADTVDSVVMSGPGTAAGATVAGGPYVLTPGGAAGTGLGNYVITYDNGTLTVTPAPLTIDPDDQMKLLGQMLAFNGTEFSATGLLNGDTVNTVLLSSAGAPAGAAPGAYAILASGATGTGLDNYTINYGQGTLAVSAAVPGPSASQVPGRAIPLGGFGGADNAVPNFAGLNNGIAGGVRVADNGQPVQAAPEVTKQSLGLSLQVLQQRSDEFTKALEQCQVALDDSKDTTAFIDCASNALEEYGDKLDDPLIQLPPELQGTVARIRQTVQRLRTANTLSDKKAAITEARAAVRDLVDFVKQQTALVSAVDPEIEALEVQHGQVMTQALEKMDLAMVSAVEI